MASSLSILKSGSGWGPNVFLFCWMFHWKVQAQPSQKACAWTTSAWASANFEKICRSPCHCCHGSAVAPSGNFDNKQLWSMHRNNRWVSKSISSLVVIVCIASSLDFGYNLRHSRKRVRSTQGTPIPQASPQMRVSSNPSTAELATALPPEVHPCQRANGYITFTPNISGATKGNALWFIKCSDKKAFIEAKPDCDMHKSKYKG